MRTVVAGLLAPILSLLFAAQVTTSSAPLYKNIVGGTLAFAAAGWVTSKIARGHGAIAAAIGLGVLWGIVIAGALIGTIVYPERAQLSVPVAVRDAVIIASHVLVAVGTAHLRDRRVARAFAGAHPEAQPQEI